MTTATLGFAIDSSPAGRAATELDALVTAATRTESAVDRMGATASRAITRISGAGMQVNQTLGQVATQTENLAQRIDRALNVRNSFGDRKADIAAYGMELDRLRGKFNPVFNVLQNYKTVLGEIRQAQRLGAISADEMAAAIGRERQAALSSIAALKQRQQAGGGGGSGQNFAATNAMFQFQDVAVTAAMGMNPLSIGLQQGSQIGGAYAGMSLKQAAATTATAVAGLVSPVSIAAVGFTALAAAALQYGSSLVGSLSTTSTALEKHEEILKRIKATFDDAAESGTEYGRRTQAAINFEANQDRTALNKALKDSLNSFLGNAGASVNASQFDFEGFGAFSIGSDNSTARFGKFTDSVKLLVDQIHAGNPDVLEFNRSVQEIANTDPSDKQLQKIAKTLLDYTKEATEAAKATEELNRQQREMTLMMSRTTAANASRDYQASNVDQRFYGQRRFDAAIAGIGARSPREIADAERRRLEAEPLDLKREDQETRQQRINQEVELSYRRANQSILDAQRERSRSLDRLLADQQSEIDLVGKTGGAAAALRKEYELTSQLRLEAARQGIEVDQKELDLIHERAKALGQLTDQYNQARFNFDIGQQMGDARLSPRNRQIATTLRQYGLPEDLNGANGRRIGQMYDWQEAKDMAKGFGSAFSSELVSGSHDIGKSFLKGFQSSLENEANKLWEKFFDGFGNLFADWLTGKSGSGGAIGSVVSAIGGGKAANDNTSGAFSGLGKLTSVTRSALPDVAATGNIADYIRNAAIKRGIDPNTALKVAQSEGGLNSWNLQSSFVKNGVREQSYGPFQLYKGGGLGNSFMDKTGLDPALAANGPAATDFALDHAAKNGWGAWYGAAKVGVGKWDGIGTGGAGSATDAVNKLAEAAGSATKGLDTFGGGLGKIGESLSTNFFPAAPSAPSGGGGGGGIFGWLGGLFSPNLSKYAGLTGLFADGTNYAPGGMAIVGERGPELVNLPQGSQVFDTNRSSRMMGGNGSGNDNSPRQLVVQVNGGSGDNHIRELARQGAQEALYQERIDQTRGGFGTTQKQYTSRKG